MLAVRWYLRYGLSYRDVEELLAERGITVDHVTIYRWVQRFTPELIDAARPSRHVAGDRWFVDETYLKVAGRWVYLYRAIDQHGQVIDVLASQKRDLAATRRFFARALNAAQRPTEVTTDRAPAYPRVLDELVPQACHVVEQYANNPIEADHGRLKARTRPMRGLKRLRCAQLVCSGHAFVQNLRHGHYELGLETESSRRLEAIFSELAVAILNRPPRPRVCPTLGNATAPVIPLQPPTGLAGYGPLALQPSLGRWEGFTYAGPSGSRSYFVYTPAGYTTDRCVAMVVMLHGCTQTAAESAAGTQWNPLADEHEFVVVYPQQGDADNALSCWNWFVPEHQERGSGEAAIIAGITGQVMTNDTRWNIDPSRVYIAGLSAGAAMATILAATYPDLYAAVGVHSGLEYLAAIEGPAGVAAMKNGGPDPVEQGEAAFQAMGGRAHVMPAIVFHSTADSVVNSVNGDQVVRQWMETNRRASNNTYQPDFTQPTTANEDLVNCLPYTMSRWNDTQGEPIQEYWLVTGMDHAWSGGAAAGSYADTRGPDATKAMWAFFANHRLPR